MKIVLLPLPLLVLAGCRNPAPGYVPTPPAPIEAVKPAEVKTPLSLMPLDLGNQWTYTMRVQEFRGGKQVGTGEQGVDYRVANVRSDGSALVVLEQEGKAIDQQVWRSTADGLYQVASGLRSVPYSPQQPLALLPLTPGRRFTWSGRGPAPGGSVENAKMTSEILAPQNVDTGLGLLSSVPVQTLIKFETVDVQSTSWFRPGVGLVRLIQESVERSGRRQVILLTLSNYAIKR